MTQSLRHKYTDDTPWSLIIPIIVVAALCVFFLIPALVNAATYYANPDSAWDTSDGSIDHPKGPLGSATVTQLEALLTAGDTLYCLNGDHGAITWSGFDEGAYVTFKAESAAAILDGINLGTGNHYISFSGFTVAYGNISCSTSSPYNSHLTFESITQYSSPNPFATTSDWVDSAKYSGIVMYYTDSLNVFNSTFSNNKNGGLFSIGDSTYVKGCTFDGWYDDGMKLGSNTYFADCIVTNQYDVDPAVHNDLLQIYTGSPPNSNITIERNFFRLHDYDRTSGYSEAQGIFTDEVTTNLIIRNNIVLTNWIAGIFLQDVDGVQIINNTVLPSDISAGNLTISVGDKNGTADNIYIYNNIAQAIGVSELAGDTYASSNNKLAPDDSLAVLFRDYSTFDLYPASTALEIINAGVDNDSIPDDDIRGYTRPDTTTGLNDIGAYEYDASEEGDETPPEGDSRTAWYATVAGAGDTTGYDYNNALPASSIFDYGQYVTAGDTVYMKTGTLASLAMPVDTLTIIVTDALTIDGTLTIPSWTDNITAGGGSAGADTVTIEATGEDNHYNPTLGLDLNGDTQSGRLINYAGNLSSYPCTTSVRFALAIPADATIDSAYLDITTIKSVGAGANTRIFGQLGNTTPITDAASWITNAASKSTNRVTLTASVGANTTIRNTVTAVIQEMIEAAGYDDSLRLFIADSTSAENDYYAILDFSDPDNDDSLAVLTAYWTEAGGEADTLPSWYYLGYDPGAKVYFDGVAGTEVAYGDLDAEDEFTVSGDTLYVRFADKGKVITAYGNIGIDNAGNIGTIVKGGGNLTIKHAMTAFDSLQYVARVILDSLFEATGADSLDRMTITNSDTVQYGTGMWTNSLSAANTVQDTTGAGGFHYLTASALESDYTLSGLTSKTPDDEYYGAVNYSVVNVVVSAPWTETYLAYNDSTRLIWTTTDDDSVVVYKRTGSAGEWSVVDTIAVAGTDTLFVTPNAADGDTTYYKVAAESDTSINDIAAPIIATRTITVTAPNGGATYTVGQSLNITWTGAGIDSVKIYLVGTDTTLIATDTDGSPYAWTVPDSTGSSWKILINSAYKATTTDISNATFTIAAAAPASTGNTNSWGNDTNSWADKPSWGTAW